MRILNLILAFIISCPLFSQPRFSVIIKGNDGASCIIFGVLNMQKQEVPLPAGINKALQCPMIAGIRDTLLVYNYASSVNLYNIVTGKNISLFALPKHCDGVSGPCWSPSCNKAMFVVINQKRDEGFENDCRIIVISFNKNSEVINTKHFDRMVNYECGSFCNSLPIEDYNFVTEDIIKYRRHLEIKDRPGEWEEILLAK